MTRRYVALWRGINVGKAKRLAMADLKQLLAGLGATNVTTLLNSGNAVFDTPQLLEPSRIRSAVRDTLGVDAAVILKTAEQWAAITTPHGITEADDPSRLLVAMTADPAMLKRIGPLITEGDERFVITPDAAYLWCANGILQSKAAVALLKTMGDGGTTRNWATVQKINALAQR